LFQLLKHKQDPLKQLPMQSKQRPLLKLNKQQLLPLLTRRLKNLYSIWIVEKWLPEKNITAETRRDKKWKESKKTTMKRKVMMMKKTTDNELSRVVVITN
jgi:hypothetical protein